MDTAPQPQADIQLVLRAHPRLLCGVRSLVRCYLADLGFDESRTYETVLAIDEACTNAIRHSYAGNVEGRLSLSLASDAEWITVTLQDEGRPAPPEKVQPRPPVSVTLDTLQPGGLGVGLIHEIFDEVRFIPGEHTGNRITMRLHRPAA